MRSQEAMAVGQDSQWSRVLGVLGLLVAAVAPAVCPNPARAELRPSWECLPAETAVMVRVPQASRFFEAVKERTKFGSVALGAGRLQGLWRLVAGEQGAAGDWSLEAFEESLRKYGLEPTDLTAALAAELGGGLVISRREGLPPVQVIVGWLEPGEAAAGRLRAAFERRVEEDMDRAGPGPRPRRIDLDLAGHEVISVVEPVMGLDISKAELEEMAQETDEAAVKARLERLRETKQVQTGERHSFMAVNEGRLLFGLTLPVTGKPGADFEALGGGDEARRIFATFLAAHAGDDEPSLAGVLRQPALVAASPAGTPLVEVVALPGRWIPDGGDDAIRGRLAQLGIDDLGGLAWRQTFDEGRWRSVMALTLPAPRHGLLEVLDQRCDAGDVPAFVTSEVSDFTQISLDLGEAFQAVRRMVMADPGLEQVANMFSVADVQAQTFLGTDLATVLSGLGSRHWLLSFPPQVAAALARARADGQAAGRTPAVADRMALVWEIADEEPFLKLLGRLAPLAGGQLEEEQGFQGIRIPGAAAVFAGRGHLVAAVGEGTLEKVLTSIRNPPAGAASLRESGVPRRAGELVAPRPARLVGLSDSTRTGGTLGMLREMVATLEPEDVNDGYRAWLAAVKKLLPSGREMEGMFGVGATSLRLTDDGLVYETAWEMPPP
jgi:hypothetical protein